jgi:hypothetical protein
MCACTYIHTYISTLMFNPKRTGRLITMPAPLQELKFPEDLHKSTWFEEGEAITRVKLSRFCDERIVLDVLKHRGEFAARFPGIIDQTAVKEFFGCYKVRTHIQNLYTVFMRVSACVEFPHDQ